MTQLKWTSSVGVVTLSLSLFLLTLATLATRATVCKGSVDRSLLLRVSLGLLRLEGREERGEERDTVQRARRRRSVRRTRLLRLDLLQRVALLHQRRGAALLHAREGLVVLREAHDELAREALVPLERASRAVRRRQLRGRR